MRPKAPCAKCQERTAVCHVKCEKYAAWKTEYQAAKEAEKAEKQKYSAQRDYATDRYHRLKRKD